MKVLAITTNDDQTGKNADDVPYRCNANRYRFSIAFVFQYEGKRVYVVESSVHHTVFPTHLFHNVIPSRYMATHPTAPQRERVARSLIQVLLLGFCTILIGRCRPLSDSEDNCLISA